MKRKSLFVELYSLCFLLLVMASMFFLSCAQPAPAPTSIAPGATTSAPAVTTKAPTSIAPATTAAAPAKPQGELVVAVTTFGNETFLPWKDAGSSQLNDLIYDMLIYFDVINRKYMPGLAERWEVSPDAMTLTYHLRKGVQWQEGWGEFTSADVKFNFERHAAPDSIGKVAQCRRIVSMETPDPYTLVVHFKDPYPTFFSALSIGDSGICQGIVCKKYFETVGEEVAARKPISTGPYKMVEGKEGSYYKFEAADSHWRVVPEFKYLTMRLVPEISTTVAMLKTGEIDLANVPAEQLADLKASGLGTESSREVGAILACVWGGIAIPEDSRYDPTYHNKDSWIDPKVRQAMTISIDRQAICKAIFADCASPAGANLFNPDINKYQYPYNPDAARQLLKDAGYPNGFSFNLISYTINNIPETPRVVEVLAGYWKQIGLEPKIVASDYSAYKSKQNSLKTAGDISLLHFVNVANVGDQVAVHLMPEGMAILFQDEGSYAIWKEGDAKVNADERAVYIDKLNQYYFENYGAIPIVIMGTTWAWNSAKLSPWPHLSGTGWNLEYVRHAQPLNTFRLFSIWPGR